MSANKAPIVALADFMRGRAQQQSEITLDKLRNAKPIATAHVTVMIVTAWYCGSVATRELLIMAGEDIDPHEVHECWDDALTAAKLIAHSTGLKIPKPA